MRLKISGAGVFLLAAAGFQAWNGKDWTIFAVGGIVLAEIWHGIGIVLREIDTLKSNIAKAEATK